jgi:hypothetical protein
MGAESFCQEAEGKTIEKAFNAGVEAAAYDYGHSGYTGSLAEKCSFVEIALPEGREVKEYVKELFREDDDRISDKWGPAGAIKTGKNRWLFFGYASS